MYTGIFSKCFFQCILAFQVCENGPIVKLSPGLKKLRVFSVYVYMGRVFLVTMAQTPTLISICRIIDKCEFSVRVMILYEYLSLYSDGMVVTCFVMSKKTKWTYSGGKERHKWLLPFSVLLE